MLRIALAVGGIVRLRRQEIPVEVKFIVQSVDSTAKQRQNKQKKPKRVFTSLFVGP